MKFAVAGIFVALAVCVSSSAIPLAWHSASIAHHVPLAHHYAAPITQYSSIDLHHGHWDNGHDDGSWDEARYGDKHGHWDNHEHHAVVHAPIVHAPIIHAPIVHAHIPHGATYTAKTRGALHTAPLAGHAVSQTSLNLAPAPGTL